MGQFIGTIISAMAHKLLSGRGDKKFNWKDSQRHCMHAYDHGNTKV